VRTVVRAAAFIPLEERLADSLDSCPCVDSSVMWPFSWTVPAVLFWLLAAGVESIFWEVGQPRLSRIYGGCMAWTAAGLPGTFSVGRCTGLLA